MTALPPARNRNLVITRAGAASLHPGWVSGATPQFDLLVTAYSEAAPVAQGEMRIAVPGPKVAGYAETFRRHPEILERYDRIALIDNDVEADARTLNACFAEGERHGLRLWQPGLSSDSYCTYGLLVQNPWFVLRFTDFVEMMCPFFEREALRAAVPMFSLGYETGIDLLWADPAMIRARQVAVLDSVAVRHTRPVGKTKAEQGFSATENYTPQIGAFLKSQGARFSFPRLRGGITKTGLRLGSGLPAMLAHAPLLRLFWQSPEPPRNCARILYQFLGFGAGAHYFDRGQGR